MAGLVLYPSETSLYIMLTLVFALVGDIFNAVDTYENSADIPGKENPYLLNALIFFSLAHILLIAAAFTIAPISWASVPAALVLAGLMTFYYILLFPSLHKNSQIIKITVPVYMALASCSLVLAVDILANRITLETVLFFSGVLLFYISDIMLAFFIFMKRWQYSFIPVWLTYAPGIFLIALSISANEFV